MDSLVSKKKGDAKVPHAEATVEETGAYKLAPHVRQKTKFASLMHEWHVCEAQVDGRWVLVHS